MTSKEYQKQFEKFQIQSILDEELIDSCTLESSESPDFIVHNYEGKTIGIEVTQYATPKIYAAENAIQKIFDEYARMLDKEGDKRYLVSVNYKNQDFPDCKSFKKVKKHIIEELKVCRNTNGPCYENEYIQEVHFTEIIPTLNSEVCPISVHWDEYLSLEDQNLIKRIHDKEKKLAEYKRDSKTVKIDEFWLCVYFNAEDKKDFRFLQIENAFESTYDRIYLSEIGACKRIK